MSPAHTVPRWVTASHRSTIRRPAQEAGTHTSRSAVAMPQVAKESQFETVVGTAVKNLFADAASGKPVSAATVKAQLSSAQQQMNG